MAVEPRYVDLQVTSNFQFSAWCLPSRGTGLYRGGARPCRRRAHRPQYAGRCGARPHGLQGQRDVRFIPGCRLDLLSVPEWRWGDGVFDWHLPPRDVREHGGEDSHEDPDGPSLLVYPTDRAAYARLCNLLTLGKRRAPKQQCFLTVADLAAYAGGLMAVALVPPAALLSENGEAEFLKTLSASSKTFSGRLCHWPPALQR